MERIEGSEWHEAPWRGPCEITEKVDQQIYKLVGSDNIAITDNTQSVLKRQKIGISQETI